MTGQSFPNVKQLCPLPKNCVRGTGFCPLEHGLFLATGVSLDEPLSGLLAAELGRFGPGLGASEEQGAIALSLVLDPAKTEPQSYSLHLGQSISIVAADRAGLFYGGMTLVQWLRLHRACLSVHAIDIEDWPDFPQRGVSLDISRDRVPTMATLYALVDLLAGLKINQLQLYMEHTFAYRDHERVWSGASPMTGEQIQALDRYCGDRHMALVPNQNSFGHFHRWLVHARYRPLAEVPEGLVHAFSSTGEPFSLCPGDPGTLALLTSLYDELLPHFTSSMFNVGMDETFDLGLGRSKEVCKLKGKTRVYLDFLLRVRDEVAKRGKRIQFWGDIIIHHPELIAELPRDMVLLEWGYEADHPFAEHGRCFAESGLEFYVCPGTSSWQSLAGRGRNALLNLASAARHGAEHGAQGYLITDWGDWGHLQPMAASYAGFIAGAAFSWHVAEAENPESLDLPALLDRYAFSGYEGNYGQTIWDLSNLYRFESPSPANGTALFYLLRYADQNMGHERLTGLNKKNLCLMHSELERIDAARRGENTDFNLEFAWIIAMLHCLIKLAATWLEAGREAPITAIEAPERVLLCRELENLIACHRQLWIKGCRPGGLDQSCARISWLLELLT